MRKILAFLAFIVLVQGVPPEPAVADCTIGVAHGSVSADGRPLLWKSRMWTNSTRNIIVYSAGAPYDFIGVKTFNNTYCMMGLNEAGLSTGNALVTSRSNGELMEHCLRNFATVAEVEGYILQQQEQGALEANGNFPFADAAGNAMIFEVYNNEMFFKYDSMDQNRALQGMLGWVVRANEFHQDPNGMDDLTIGGRYRSGRLNIAGLVDDVDLLTAGTIMHGNNGAAGYEFMRYGPNRPWATIAEWDVRSSMVVHGVLPTEDPLLSTMWVSLGHANFAIAVPTWTYVTTIPTCLNDGSMAIQADALNGTVAEATVQASVFPVEIRMFAEVEELLVRWRTSSALARRDMARVETQMAEDAYGLLYCLGNVQSDNKAPVVKTAVSGPITAYVILSGRDIAIDNLDVTLPENYRYKDDFSTDKATRDSYKHSIFWPENAFPPAEPYLFYTRIVQPPQALAFADYYGQPATLAYCFATFPNAISPVRPRMELDVYDLGLGYGSYSLSANGTAWTLPMPLGFGHQRIPLMQGQGYTRRFDAKATDADGTVVEIAWDFGDNTTGSGATVWHTYARGGWYLVSCTATDDDGVSLTDWTYVYLPVPTDPDIDPHNDPGRTE